jgi:two-component system OmpR family response regulator
VTEKLPTAKSKCQVNRTIAHFEVSGFEFGVWILDFGFWIFSRGPSSFLKVRRAIVRGMNLNRENIDLPSGGFCVTVAPDPSTLMRILIVEDEPDLRHALARAVRDAGYAVDIADNGEDGLFNAENTDYDAIILDVMLPKLDGWEVLARLRKSKKTPVLMLTARDQSRDRVRGLDTGADDYVIKPFDLPELFARLRALIRRSAGKTSNVLEIGDVMIDTAARNISRLGKAIEITAREYALVEFLALHRGEVVTRTTLYEHLFDEDDATLSNLLDVHVSNIRKKLGHEFIVTRRGHGYCIE